MPETPLRLKILERIISVLSSIKAGEEYFFTPHEVVWGFKDWETVNGSPVYAVSQASGGRIEYFSYQNFDEEFIISIKGIIKSKTPTADLEKSLQDIRRAIHDDFINGDSGSLRELAIVVELLEAPETDNGYLSYGGIGIFDQLVKIKINQSMI